MTTVAATMSIMNAIVTPTSHDLERRTKKPVSAAISSAVAINSAIRPYPCDVIMGSYYANGDGFDPVEVALFWKWCGGITEICHGH